MPFRVWLRLTYGAMALLGGALFAVVVTLANREEAPTTASALDFRPVAYLPPSATLVDPPSVPADQVGGEMDDGESVLGVVVGGEARAYPVEMINRISREVLNDTLGGRDVAVTWCSICQTGLAFDRRVGGRRLTFHVSGELWADNLIMVDDQTGSRWSQILGKAMDGPMKGTSLEPIPATVSDWGHWRRAHPGTTVLRWDRSSRQAPSNSYRFAARTGDLFMLGVNWGGHARGWTLDRLRAHPVINDTIGGRPVLVTFDDDSATARLFAREVDGRALTFRARGRDLVDTETGSRWDRLTGRAEEGALKGRSLDPIPGAVIYREKWSRFFPETEFWVPEDGNGG